MSRRVTTSGLPTRLRNARQNMDMSQPELAQALGLSKQLISAWENGKAQMYARQVVACARILGVELNWLLLGEGSPGEAQCHLTGRVPLLNTQEVHAFAAGQLPLASVHRHVVFGSTAPTARFAALVTDSSMSPVFLPGDIALVNPCKQPQQADVVLAAVRERNGANEASDSVMVRQISFLMQVAAPPMILAPVSPDWPVRRLATRNDGHIIGVVEMLIRKFGSSELIENPHFEADGTPFMNE